MQSKLGHIPVGIIFYVFSRSSLKKTLATYLILKYNCPEIGYYPSKREAFLVCQKNLDYSLKTFNRHLNILIQYHFVREGSKNDIFISGYKYILKGNKIEGYRRKIELQNKNLMVKGVLKPYLFSGMIDYIIRQKLYKAKFGELEKDDLLQLNIANKKMLKMFNRQFPISSRYLEIRLGIPSSTAQRYIQSACKLGFLKSTKNLEPLNLPQTQLRRLISDYIPGRPFPVGIKGYIFLRYPDYLTSLVTSKRYIR